MVTIGKSIYSILSGNTSVTALVGNNIYPLVIPEGGILPCIVYERSYNNLYVKDGLSGSDNAIDITILAVDYETAINISIAVFNALNMYTGLVNNTRIFGIKLTGGGEAYAEGAFIQRLNFDVKSS